MGLEFLNSEEDKKMASIKEFLTNINIEKYNQRFSDFDTVTMEIISWGEITDWISKLATLIKDKNYTGIYGIPRGGLILATLLSYKTGLPMLQTPCQNCLVVDDDASTGLTLLPYYNRYDIALMYKNPDCKLKPTYLYKEYGEIFKVFVWNIGNEN